MKKLLALVLAIMMVLSVASFAAAEEEKVLTIVTWDATTTPYLTAQKEAFEAANPGITIEYVDVASQDYAMKAGTMLAGGDTSDIYMVKEITDMLNWKDAGYIEALTPFAEAANYDLSGFVGIDGNYAVDGVQYALPFRSDFWVLFYNKDLFDAAGKEYPTNDMTWDQFADLAIAMSDTEKDIWGAHYHTWLSAVVNWDVCDGVNTLIDGNYDDMAYFYNVYQKIEDNGGCMPYAEVKASGLHYSGAFGNGNIAMMPMGYWYVSTLINNINKGEYKVGNWGIVAVPHADGVAAGSSFGNLTGVAINAKSENKDLAWQYISWLAGEEGAKATASVGARPAWVSEEVAATMASVAGFPTDEASKAALIPALVSIELPASAHSSEISSVLNEEHTLIMTRENTVEEGIEAMNERVAEILGK